MIVGYPTITIVGSSRLLYCTDTMPYDGIVSYHNQKQVSTCHIYYTIYNHRMESRTGTSWTSCCCLRCCGEATERRFKTITICVSKFAPTKRVTVSVCCVCAVRADVFCAETKIKQEKHAKKKSGIAHKTERRRKNTRAADHSEIIARCCVQPLAEIGIRANAICKHRTKETQLSEANPGQRQALL